MNILSNVWFWVGILVLNDLLIGYSFYLLWQRAFLLHVVQCECGSFHMVTQDIQGLERCANCCDCENCGRYLKCKTCGKEHWVGKNIDGIGFCDAIGCLEKYKRNQVKLNKKNKSIQ